MFAETQRTIQCSVVQVLPQSFERWCLICSPKTTERLMVPRRLQRSLLVTLSPQTNYQFRLDWPKAPFKMRFFIHTRNEPWRRRWRLSSRLQETRCLNLTRNEPWHRTRWRRRREVPAVPSECCANNLNFHRFLALSRFSAAVGFWHKTDFLPTPELVLECWFQKCPL